MPKQDRNSGRASYDLTPEIKQRIKDISVELGVPQLLLSLAEVEAGDIDLIPPFVVHWPQQHRPTTGTELAGR